MNANKASKKLICRITGTCAISLLASHSYASQIEEIVVSATRQLESMQDIPISLTALSGTKLDEKQVVDVISLGTVVPGMQVKQTLNPVSVTTSIRGVTQLNATVNVDPPIGIYIDGVYNVLNAGSNNAMIDLQRVEVLKGPQGTLFGRNTIGGTISIQTMEPTELFEGYLQADAGNYGALGSTVVVNVPIKEGVLATRLAYNHTEHDGYGRNRTTGNEAGTLDQDYVRGSALWTITDAWESLTSASYTYSSGYAAGFRLGYFSGPLDAGYPAASGAPGDLMSNYVNRGDYQDSFGDQDATFALRQYGITETITGELSDSVSLKSITGYIDTEVRQAQDFDGTPYPFLSIAGYPISAEQYSQELQLFGDALGGDLNWITGLYYFQVEASQISDTRPLTNLAPPALRTRSSTGVYAENSSYSGFLQGTYDLTPEWRLTAGARYVIDEREATYRDHQTSLVTGNFTACTLANDPLAPVPDNCLYSDSEKYHYVPWTIGIDYKPNADTLLYAKLSKGFRSGAFPLAGPAAASALLTATQPAQAALANAATLTAFKPVDPEKLLSPEIGAKLELLDRRLRLNAALYYSEYQNLQVNVNLPPACPTCAPIAALENSGEAHIYGGELEVTGIIGNLQLDAALGYTHPEYVSGSSYDGLPIINVSKVTSSLTATYPIEFDSGSLALALTYSYRSSQTYFTPPPNKEAEDAVSQDGFGLLSGRIGYRLKSAPVTLALYGQNLTDKEYSVAATAFAAPLNFGSYVGGTPRTLGGSVKYEF